MTIKDPESGKIDPDKVKEKIKDGLNEPVRVWHVLLGALLAVGANAAVRGYQDRRLQKSMNCHAGKNITLHLAPGDKLVYPSGDVKIVG